MKTIEQLIFEKKFKGEEFNANDYNDWAKENEWEAYQLCLEVANQLNGKNERLTFQAKDLLKIIES